MLAIVEANLFKAAQLRPRCCCCCCGSLLKGSLAWLLKKARSYRCGHILINSYVSVELSRISFQRSACDRLVIGSCYSIDL